MARVDTLVVFYHPGRPGLHKRLRGEYRGPVYVEASHPAAALLGGVELGWSVAGLAVSPIYTSVYYWEETLREARGDARLLFERLSGALAKRLDLFIPPRLAGLVEVGVVPEPGMLGGWVFDSTPGHVLLYTLYHMASWISSLELAASVRLYIDVSLAPPLASRALIESGLLAALWLGASGHTVDFRVYAAPHVGPGPWRTPLVPLLEVLRVRVERGVAAGVAAAAWGLALRGGRVVSARGPGVRVPERLARRLEGLSLDSRLASLSVFMALPHALAALVCGLGSGGGFRLVSRLLSELVSADLGSISIRARVEGGVVAHGLSVEWEPLLLVGVWGVLRDAYSWLCGSGLRLGSLGELAARMGSPLSPVTSRLLENVSVGEGGCGPEAWARLLLVKGVVEPGEGGILRIDSGCVRKLLSMLLAEGHSGD